MQRDVTGEIAKTGGSCMGSFGQVKYISYHYYLDILYPLSTIRLLADSRIQITTDYRPQQESKPMHRFLVSFCANHQLQEPDCV